MIVMMVSEFTSDVLKLNGALVAPAGTVTTAGGCAASLFDHTDTVAPPAGATFVRVTVPVAVLPPAIAGVPRLIELSATLPTKGFEVTKASAALLESLATRFVAVDAKATTDPPRPMFHPHVLLFPACPLAARLTTAV
jgi:hypothetical protein